MLQVRPASRRLVQTLSAFLPKEVESYSCYIFVWRSFVNSGLQNGYKKWCVRDARQSDAAFHWDAIMTVLLEAFAKPGARDFSEIDWLRLVHEGSSKTRFEYCGLLPSNKRTLGWNSNRPWVIEVHSNSLQLERVYLSQGLFFHHTIYPSKRTDSGWKGNPQRTADCLLHTTKPIWWRSWRRRTPWWLKSIRNDLSNGSEESSRAIYEMGNMELIVLKQTLATIQCLSCLKHVPEGLNMSQCGVWLRPNQSTTERIKIAFAASKTPYFRTAEISSRGKKSGRNPWQTDHAKAMDARRGATKTAANSPLHWTDGRTTRSTELLNWCTVGLRNMSSTSTTSPHPRVMSRSLPHLTLTTTHFTYLSDTFPTHTTFGTRTIFTLRISTAEWRINTNPISHKRSTSYSNALADKATRHIGSSSPTTFKVVGRRVSRHLHPQHGQKAEPGGALHLGPSTAKKAL